MTQKGFTLIELLAILIILSLIITIAYPIVTKTIHSSKEKAAIDCVYGYVRAVESSIAKEAMNHPSRTYTGEYRIQNDKIVNTDDSTDLRIFYQGAKPTGTLEIENRIVKRGEFTINGFTLSYNDNKVVKN